MDKRIIKQLSSMRIEVIDKLEQKKNFWNNIVSAYSTSWEAIGICSNVSSADQLELVSDFKFFAETVGEISAIILLNEQELLAIAEAIIEVIEEKDVEKLFKKQEILQFGDMEAYKASRLCKEAEAIEELKRNAKIALAFARIMCDVTGLNNVAENSYQQYNNLYNKLAKFLYLPLRGYSKEEWISMSLEEFEYIDAQIKVRQETEKMAPFMLANLETIRQQIKKQISLKKLRLLQLNFNKELLTS